MAAMLGVSQTNRFSMSNGHGRCGWKAGLYSLRDSPSAERQLLFHLFDRLLVWRLSDGMDVPGHDVHVRLEDLRELVREVRLDDHESRTTTGQGVPAFDPLGMVRAQLMLLNQPPGNHRPVNPWIPREPAIEEHAFLPLARDACRCPGGCAPIVPNRRRSLNASRPASYTEGGFQQCA